MKIAKNKLPEAASFSDNISCETTLSMRAPPEQYSETI